MAESFTQSGENIDAELSSFVADLSFGDVPESAVRTAERAFVDTVGVTLAGAAKGAGETAITAMPTITTDCDGMTILGVDRKASVTDATFLNVTSVFS